jgi:DinB superfamily
MPNPEELFTAVAVKSFKQGLDRATKFFSPLTDDQLRSPIAPGKNRLLYLYGHLIAVNDGMIPLFALGDRLYPDLEATFITSPDGPAAEAHSAASLTAAWTAVNQKLLAAFDSFTPAQWLERHTAVTEEAFATQPERNRFAILLSRTSHLGYHLGQTVLAPK